MTANASKKRVLASASVALSIAVGLAACEPLAITSFGVGASTAVSHTLGGITYRTFTASAPRVRAASIAALARMGILLASSEQSKGVELLHATAHDRSIEITLEPISANATRMRVVARNGGIFYDSATAAEIILQTERSLGSA